MRTHKDSTPDTAIRIRVLCVEDREEDAELCLRELERGGFDVSSERVETLAEFTLRLRAGAFDVVIADYRLPGWTGLDALDILRREEFDVPLILVTGSLGEETAAECIRRGAADYVLKDRLARLPVAVRGALRDKALRLERARAQQELSVREAMFRLLFANSPLPMFVCDDEMLEFVEVNEAATVQYGYSREDLLEMRFPDLLPPEEALRLPQEVARRSLHAPYVGEWKQRLKDGQIIDVEIRARMFLLSQRPVWLAVARDITERKSAEEALQESEIRYRRLFEAAKDGILILDASTGVILDVNSFLMEFLGYAREEFLGKRLWEIGLFKDIEESQAAFEELQHCGYIRYEHLPLKAKDGSHLHVEFISNVYRAGAATIIQCNIRDISERRKAEAVLRESEIRYRRLFEAAKDGILILDASTGVILDVNSFLLDLLCYSREDLLGKHLWEIGQFSDIAGNRAAFEELQHRGYIRYEHLPLKAKDGSHLHVEFISNVYQAGAAKIIQCNIRDISERRRAEDEIQRLNADLEQRVEARTAQLAELNDELEVRNRDVEHANLMKSEFLASMSHELRTPLNAILGFSSLLAELSPGPLTEKQLRFVQHIHRGGQHLLQLINDILDLSKIEAGRMELHQEACSVQGTLRDVFSLIGPLAAAKQIRLESPAQNELSVYADPVRFRQILYNLLSNAVKFTPDGGQVTVEVSGNPQSVCLVVRDTGVGIAASELENIFNEFHQVGTTTKGVREGTGLGLAITRRLVEQHGGKIWAESDPNHGSRFHVSLPARTAANPPPAAASEAARPERTAPLVLIVDDDSITRELLVDYLRPEGYETLTAASGAEALLLAAQRRPDAITLNMLTPGKSGWHILTELKSATETASIPVILVSVIDRKKIGFAMGAAEYLLKPVSKRDLLEALGKHIKPKSPQLGPPTVLVVDDAPHDLQMIAELLQSSGYSALTAGGGSEALRILEELRPDAVLLDLLMPEVDGFEVLRQIRQKDDWRDLPVFVLTAKDLTELDVETLRRETLAFFRKGIPWRDELLKQLRQATDPAASIFRSPAVASGGIEASQ